MPATKKKVNPARKPAPRAKPVRATAVKAQALKAPAASRKTAPASKPIPVAAKADKPKKAKLVRDSFTIPKAEYGVLQALKDRAAKLGQPAKKSELLRAGIASLAGLADAAFLSALAAVPTIKTGRPAKD